MPQDDRPTKWSRSVAGETFHQAAARLTADVRLVEAPPPRVADIQLEEQTAGSGRLKPGLRRMRRQE